MGVFGFFGWQSVRLDISVTRRVKAVCEVMRGEAYINLLTQERKAERVLNGRITKKTLLQSASWRVVRQIKRGAAGGFHADLRIK